MNKILASLPSPDINILFSIGPFKIHIYAICILLGFTVAYFMTNRRYLRRADDPDLILETVTVGGVTGIIGARIGAVITYPDYYFGPGHSPWQVFKIWEGGLAIYGGLALGFVGVVLWTRYRGATPSTVIDCAVPAVALAQGIGRLGNWFNQEVFGMPTTLPWGLEIDDAHLPPGYPSGTLFHPTFLYELLWNVAVCVFLLWADSKARGQLLLADQVENIELGQIADCADRSSERKVFFARWFGRPWQLSGWYMVSYGIGRAFIESIRIDESLYIFGAVRLFTVVSIVTIIVGIIVICTAKEPKKSEQKQQIISKTD